MELEEWLGPENTLGISIWKKKYQTNDETFEEWLDRVSGGDVEVKKLIKSKKFCAVTSEMTRISISSISGARTD